MSFSKGKKIIEYLDILKEVTEEEILNYYLGISKIPCLIKSPLREDNKPSFGLYYSKVSGRIKYSDFSTKDRGSLVDLLKKLWNLPSGDVINQIYYDIPKYKTNKTLTSYLTKTNKTTTNSSKYIESTLECRIREWKSYDIEYWESYGISLKWLKYAEVYPISYIFITKDNTKMTFKADKYAYSYVERKEGKITLKIYQPFNKKGFKWTNKHDSSVISLWTKVPEKGDKICICSSVKDALCLSANTNIPAIAIQGEGYSISKTAINNLKERYKNIYILLDNDAPGIKDAEKLAKETGFINLVLPIFEGGKDISDLYKILNNKQKFKQILLNLFNN